MNSPATAPAIGNKRKRDSNGHEVDGSDDNLLLSAVVAQAAHRLCPQYHFASGSDSFFERAPYATSSTRRPPNAPAFTRFFGIAPACNTQNQKVLDSTARLSTIDGRGRVVLMPLVFLDSGCMRHCCCQWLCRSKSEEQIHDLRTSRHRRSKTRSRVPVALVDCCRCLKALDPQSSELDCPSQHSRRWQSLLPLIAGVLIRTRIVAEAVAEVVAAAAATFEEVVAAAAALKLKQGLPRSSRVGSVSIARKSSVIWLSGSSCKLSCQTRA